MLFRSDTESDANIQPEEMLTFFSNEYSICIPAEIPECVSYNITYQRKAQYAYCGGFFLCRNRYLCEDASRISPMIVSMEFVILLCSMASI